LSRVLGPAARRSGAEVVHSVWRLSYGLDNRGLIAVRGNEEIFLFATASRPPVGPKHPTIQWKSGLFPRGKAVEA